MIPKPCFFLMLIVVCISSASILLFSQKSYKKCACSSSIQRFIDAYNENEVFKMLIDKAFENMQQVPDNYREGGNPWIGKNFDDLILFLTEWCEFLPVAEGSTDDGLKYIEQMDLFSYNNPFGRAAFQSYPGIILFKEFADERGKYMDSPESTKFIAEWLSDPRIEREDYSLPDPEAPDGGFKSFNEFFSRPLKDQDKVRPLTMPDRDYVISAPTDALMNSMPVKIVDYKTEIRTKGSQQLNIEQLLDGSENWRDFVGGTALSCVLMPNTYHRYHSPVGGEVIESKIIQGALLGMEDFPKFVPVTGNVGYYGTDFSYAENYQRGYFIIDTKKYGKVAVVPVGLSTIGSVVFRDKFMNIANPVPVKRGEELGHFLYGGSHCILVFEPNMFKSDAIQVRLGNQIGTFDTDSNK